MESSLIARAAAGSAEGFVPGAWQRTVERRRPVGYSPVAVATTGLFTFKEPIPPMTRLIALTSVALFAATPAYAQAPGGAPQKVTLAQGLQRAYDGVKRNLTEMAEKMPEADYSYKPHADSRMFGQLFAHAANSMYGSCSALKGVANPNQGKNLEELLKSLTDANIGELVKQGQNEVARGSIVAGLTSHNNEMYGTGAAYMRAKGLVPPSTERQQQATRKPGA
jgi:hypothetical protein